MDMFSRSSACGIASSSCATRSDAVSSSLDGIAVQPAAAERAKAHTLPRVSRRLALTLIALSVAALATAVAATLAARSDDDTGPAAEVIDVTEPGAQASAARFKGAVRPRTPVRDFALRDQDGRPVRLTALRGKVVALAPMYTRCRDSCPLVAQQIRVALDKLSRADRKRVVALALSVDPLNDTPRSAQRFLAEQHVRPYLDFLIGTPSRLRPIWRTYGFASQGRGTEHNSYVVLIDRSGRQRVGFALNFLTPESLAHDLRELMAERT